jgi:hypothetical protein
LFRKLAIGDLLARNEFFMIQHPANTLVGLLAVTNQAARILLPSLLPHPTTRDISIKYLI